MPAPMFPLSGQEIYTFNDLLCVGNALSTLILGFSAMLATAAIVWGGIKIITSSGNEEGVAGGKNIIKWALIGLIVIALARVFVYQTLNILQTKNPQRFLNCEEKFSNNN